MKTAVAAGIVVVLAAGSGGSARAQVQTAANQRVQVTPPAASLNAILQQVQQSTNSDQHQYWQAPDRKMEDRC